MNGPSPLIRFFGLRQSMVGLLIMVILIGLGEKMGERFLPIYLLALGGGALSIGLLNGLTNLLSALYAFPGGYLSDRLGYKRALLLFNLLAMAGYGLVVFVPAWPAVIVGAVFFLVWSAVSLPATMSLIAGVLPADKRTMGVSVHSLVRRIPMALGPLIGGALIYRFGERDGVRLAFLGALILAVIALFVQQALIASAPPARRAEKNPFRLWRYMSPELRNLLLSDILIRFAEQIPYAFVVVWCMKMNGVSAVGFGVLTTIEMATAMLVYVPVAYLADQTAKKPFITATFVFFTIFPLVLLFARSFTLLAMAFMIRGLKEFGEPARKALILDLAPEELKAGMFGLYYLLRDIIVSVAAFGGAFLWQVSPAVNLIAAFVFGLAGTAYFAAFGRGLPLRQRIS